MQRFSSVVIVGRPGQEFASMQPQLQARFNPTQEPAILRGNENVHSLQADARFQQQPIERGPVVGEKGWSGAQGRVPPLPLSQVAHAARSRSVPWNPGERNMIGWGPVPGAAAGAPGLPIDGRDSRRLYSSLTGNSVSNGRRSMHLVGQGGHGVDNAGISRGSSMAKAEAMAIGRKQVPSDIRISRSLSPGRRQAAVATSAATATAAASSRRGGRGHAAALASIYLDRLNDGLPKTFKSNRNVTPREQQPSNSPREVLQDLLKETFQGGEGSGSGGGGGRGGAGQHEFMDRRSTQDRRFGPGSPR